MRRNNRDAILATARELFLKHGFNGISIRTIASEAKLTTGAVYFHFKNKKDIYKTICLEATDKLLEKFQNAVAEQSNPQNKLISTYDAYLSFYEDNRDYYNILMEYKSAYDSEDDPEMDEIVQKMNKLIKIMSQAVFEGRDKKMFRDIDPIKLAIFLASVTEGMLQYKKLGILDIAKISDKDFRSFMADIIGYGIMTK